MGLVGVCVFDGSVGAESVIVYEVWGAVEEEV